MKALIPLLVVALAAASCVPSTPQARIERNPELFAALAPKDQELVRQGLIAKGMHQDAVFLAWGPPSARLDGFKDGKATERWDYTGSYPVYTSSFYGGYGPWGWYGPHAGPYYGYGWGPAVTYLPYCHSRVWFVDRKVDAWERMR
ncbi:MAG: hypothetical protein MUF04_02155 [Akkermansiaceae bacterium]|nr:hypothetical protein [Akkermansiaceae bacterium]